MKRPSVMDAPEQSPIEVLTDQNVVELNCAVGHVKSFRGLPVGQGYICCRNRKE
jgi:hypothetical protein